jgi:hypothetical protein
LLWVVGAVLFLAGLVVHQYARAVSMPGESWRGALPPLTEEQGRLRDALRRDVEHLAGEIGERNMPHILGLREAADWLETSLSAAGLEPERHPYDVDGQTVENLSAEVAGGEAASEILVVGAHYDSVVGSPGANDNASGVAATLALARAFAGTKPRRTVRFLFFVNEEPPWFQTRWMGSNVYAKACRERGDDIVGMLSLETMGYYADAEGSQEFPFTLSLFYPSRGDFVTCVGNSSSRDFVRGVVGSFRRLAQFPSEGAALPGMVSAAGLSDHWSFWQAGYKGLMVTDTAMFRYPWYHRRQDTPDKLDYERLARVVDGLHRVVADLAGP